MTNQAFFNVKFAFAALRDIGVSADQERDRKLEAQSNKQMLARNHREYMNTFQPPTIHDMLVFYPTRPGNIKRLNIIKVTET